jgi:5'-methylthioadenosine phosphorylase
MVGVIGGSGLYEMAGFRKAEDRLVKTPYGEPSGPYTIGELSGIEVAFLPRHGPAHRIPPDRINYRANIWGFRELGVERIISVSASGGINREYLPGEIVLLDQVIDMVQGMRPCTFYGKDEVVHVDFTEPYCPELRQSVIEAGKKAGIGLRKTGTYICVNGPRLESRAEIRFFGMIGADVVGMTGMPETSLARELEICFAGLTVVTNYAAGISERKLTTVEVVEKMKESTERIKLLLRETLASIPGERGCPCREALKDARM